MSRPNELGWTVRADSDLLAIWAYLLEHASEDIANEQLRKMDAACASLISHPFKGRPRNEVRPGVRSILVGSYVVFYQVGEIEIEILRVLHGRRDFRKEFAPES